MYKMTLTGNYDETNHLKRKLVKTSTIMLIAEIPTIKQKRKQNNKKDGGFVRFSSRQIHHRAPIVAIVSSNTTAASGSRTLDQPAIGEHPFTTKTLCCLNSQDFNLTIFQDQSAINVTPKVSQQPAVNSSQQQLQAISNSNNLKATNTDKLSILLNRSKDITTRRHAIRRKSTAAVHQQKAEEYDANPRDSITYYSEKKRLDAIYFDFWRENDFPRKVFMNSLRAMRIYNEALTTPVHRDFLHHVSLMRCDQSRIFVESLRKSSTTSSQQLRMCSLCDKQFQN
ncbi:hypothetical protein L5515_019507 [Caenorhabditis briggsae]|uniref:Uncharacterized protein n=1 Tax=Caenorhabditis briggsae TaxID=6238 RepID=A0AAE9JU67_CAEBR|nr:hypothetical protein L5515_019507 [Caenorhabditis briggsae]